MKRFSFIIPAFNEENYIARCIKSIKNQTLNAFEIIVVDNGSTDATEDVARKHGSKVVHEDRKGIAHARNKGAKEAKGDIFCFIDADSTLSKNWIKRASNHFENGADAVVGVNVFVNKNPLKFIWYNVYTVIAHFALLFQYIVQGRLHLSAGNLAITKEAFEKTGGYEPYVGEDYWLSKHFWDLQLKGVFDLSMIVFCSSRGFEKRGYIKTIWFWIKSTLYRVDQSNYSYKSKV